MLSLRTMFDPARAEGAGGRIGFRLGEETFLVRISEGELGFVRDMLDDADLVFGGEPAALAGVIYGGQPLAALEAAGAIRLEGDRALAERFITWFPLPPKAAPAG
jgi:hypothetical protein